MISLTGTVALSVVLVGFVPFVAAVSLRASVVLLLLL